MENGKDVRDAGDEKQTRHFLQSEEMAEKVADQNPPVIAQRRVLSSGDVCIIGQCVYKHTFLIAQKTTNLLISKGLATALPKPQQN